MRKAISSLKIKGPTSDGSVQVFQFPVYRGLAEGKQYRIGFGKMSAPEKAVIGGKRRRMRRFQNEMTRIRDQTFFGSRGCSPQQKHYGVGALVQTLYHGVGQLFPTLSFVRKRFVAPDGEYCVQ